jgi:hypothetical protein
MPETRTNPDVSVADDGLTGRLSAIPDPEYAAQQRRLLVSLCDLFGAGNTAGDWYVDPSICASTWLGAIADRAYDPDGAS